MLLKRHKNDTKLNDENYETGTIQNGMMFRHVSCDGPNICSPNCTDCNHMNYYVCVVFEQITKSTVLSVSQIPNWSAELRQVSQIPVWDACARFKSQVEIVMIAEEEISDEILYALM